MALIHFGRANRTLTRNRSFTNSISITISQTAPEIYGLGIADRAEIIVCIQKKLFSPVDNWINSPAVGGSVCLYLLWCEFDVFDKKTAIDVS